MIKFHQAGLFVLACFKDRPTPDQLRADTDTHVGFTSILKFIREQNNTHLKLFPDVCQRKLTSKHASVATHKFLKSREKKSTFNLRVLVLSEIRSSPLN